MGSNHDSPTFHESRLGKVLESSAEDLRSRGLFLVGDSAYSLRSYLLVPYDNSAVKSKEDSFNFFLSSCRIYVECCFGEIDRRWGVLWKPLVGKLKNHKHTIDACLRLHNFIVDYREDKKRAGCQAQDQGSRINNLLFRDEIEEDEELNRASDQFIRNNPFHSFGGSADNYQREELGQRGRRTNAMRELRDEGVRFRDEICNELERKGMVRPTVNQSFRRDRHYRPVME